MYLLIQNRNIHKKTQKIRRTLRFHTIRNVKSTLFIIFVFSFLIYTFRSSYYLRDYFLKFNTKNSLDEEMFYIYDGSEDFLINTKGCYIPNYGKTLKIYEDYVRGEGCGKRAVFLQRTVDKQELNFRLDSKFFNKYGENTKVNCWYSFARRVIGRREKDMLSFTRWKQFENGTNITIKDEIVLVRCEATFPSNKTFTIYEDAYVFIKRINVNMTKREPEKTWNVLLIGMDTMSRARLRSSMPRTAKYFQDYGWLDYRGYHKVHYNTFPNMMAFLTGRTTQTVHSRCSPNMNDCSDLFIWNSYRDAGYMTAYAEDDLGLPDTFAGYGGFRIYPTHHYIHPFFLTGEKEKGNIVCAHHRPSALQLLNYAYDFTNVYKENKFFGIFWINSYSHDLTNIPRLLDNDMVKFFESLNENEILNNTIVLFMSDHGFRFIRMRMPIESYYEERLPMLFVWIPHDFRKMYQEKFNSLLVNQNRLLTPYDIYLTLAELSSNFKSVTFESEACPLCTSLFVKKSVHRTCEDASISEKWCSCHTMTEADLNDSATNKSIFTAVKYIQDVAKSIETKTSTRCRPTRLRDIIRAHRYLGSGNKTLYVIAWSMTPGDMSYEATVAQDGDNYYVVPPTNAIASYRNLNTSYCLKSMYDGQFCVCQDV